MICTGSWHNNQWICSWTACQTSLRFFTSQWHLFPRKREASEDLVLLLCMHLGAQICIHYYLAATKEYPAVVQYQTPYVQGLLAVQSEIKLSFWFEIHKQGGMNWLFYGLAMLIKLFVPKFDQFRLRSVTHSHKLCASSLPFLQNNNPKV